MLRPDEVELLLLTTMPDQQLLVARGRLCAELIPHGSRQFEAEARWGIFAARAWLHHVQDFDQTTC